MFIGDLDHIDLAVQAQVGAGHGQGGAPLSGPGLGGDAFQALLFGIVGLGNGGVELVAAAGVVALELVINIRRGAQGFFQVIGPHQGGGAEGLIVVLDFLGDVDIGSGVVQLLLHQLLAKYAAQGLGGHRLEGGGVQQGGGLILHIGPEVVPLFGQLRFVQIDFVRDVVHDACSFFERFWCRDKTKRPCLCKMQGQERQTPAVPPGLAHTAPTLAYHHTPAFLVTVSHLRLTYWGILPFSSPSQGHSSWGQVPRSHRPQLAWTLPLKSTPLAHRFLKG